jgi:hypothetical protein
MYGISQILDKLFRFQREKEQLFIPPKIVEAPSTSQAIHLSPLDGPSTKRCDSCDKTLGTVNDIQFVMPFDGGMVWYLYRA